MRDDASEPGRVPGHVGERLRFDSFALAPKQGEQAWRELVYPVIEVDALTRGEPVGGSVDACALGDHVISLTRSGAQRGRRDPALMTAHPLDFYILMVVIEGSVTGCYEGREVALAPGDLVVEDMDAPRTNATPGSTVINYIVPRARLAALCPDEYLHGRLLPARAPTTRLLRSHLRGLLQTAPALPPCSVDGWLDGANALIATGLAPGRAARDDELRGHVQQALKASIERFIDEHVTDPHLTVAAIQRRFRLSRTHLYRLFRPDGGVAAAIRHRRARWAAAALLDKGGRGYTYELRTLAYDAGFDSEARLRRAFRAHFGMSPSELRERALAQRPADTVFGPSDFYSGVEAFIREVVSDAG
ncbi:helix-turn-helix domain-containing protein [Arhodomonas sp. AD133]|uniref:helix-turn-helix domain-containing protein n=1 Tax=Arhodomonas sp. AD133 TaxID=3415009 RepID=UPI003EBF8756